MREHAGGWPWKGIPVLGPDKWGFSSAEVWASVLLLVAVVRGTQVEVVTQGLQSIGLSSDGDDFHYVQSDLDTTTPYCVSVETQTR